jgi:hypothetical protein
MLSAGDIVYILFLAICVWLAVYLWDDGDGGGRKAKIPA